MMSGWTSRARYPTMGSSLNAAREIVARAGQSAIVALWIENFMFLWVVKYCGSLWVFSIGREKGEEGRGLRGKVR